MPSRVEYAASRRGYNWNNAPRDVYGWRWNDRALLSHLLLPGCRSECCPQDAYGWRRHVPQNVCERRWYGRVFSTPLSDCEGTEHRQRCWRYRWHPASHVSRSMSMMVERLAVLRRGRAFGSWYVGMEWICNTSAATGGRENGGGSPTSAKKIDFGENVPERWCLEPVPENGQLAEHPPLMCDEAPATATGSAPFIPASHAFTKWNGWRSWCRDRVHQQPTVGEITPHQSKNDWSSCTPPVIHCRKGYRTICARLISVVFGGGKDQLVENVEANELMEGQRQGGGRLWKGGRLDGLPQNSIVGPF